MASSEPSGPTSLATPHGPVKLPAFFPDATRGVVRTLDAIDLKEIGLPGLVVNAWHLSNRPGASVVKALGGIHAFTGWPGPILADSGGFQVFSLLSENPAAGSVSKKGFRYGRGDDAKWLTPEKSIRAQVTMGADICVCLDHCTGPGATKAQLAESVEHTLAWARTCKQTFEELMATRDTKPLLFGVVQGGHDRDARARCAEELVALGFDGYAFGGWPVAADGGLDPAVALVADLVPKGPPLWALGVGKPHNVVRAAHLGYTLFDCTLPTRDGRRGRLYKRREDGPVTEDAGSYKTLYMGDEKHKRSAEPVDADCVCRLCTTVSRGALHHLFRVRDPVAFRLATIHNLAFYVGLTKDLQEARDHGA